MSTLEISSSLSWTLYVHNVRIETSGVPLLCGLSPCIKSADDVHKILLAVSKSQFCVGNEFEKFSRLVDARNGTLKDSQGTYAQST